MQDCPIKQVVSFLEVKKGFQEKCKYKMEVQPL